LKAAISCGLQHWRLVWPCLGHHAIYFFADSWRVVGPFWPAPRDVDLVLLAGNRLRNHGFGTVAGGGCFWRIISGITTSNIATAYAYVTDVTKPTERASRSE